jgi:hypothetical protein
MTEAKKDAADLANVGAPQEVEVRGATQNAGQPQAAAAKSSKAAKTDSDLSLRTFEEGEEPVIPSVKTLEYKASETSELSDGQVFRKGDRITVNATDAAALLELTVDGKSAFKEV